MSWRHDVLSALVDFQTVSAPAGDPLTLEEEVEFLPAPHRQSQDLPQGKVAIYRNWFDDPWLKVGQAGPNLWNLRSFASSVRTGLCED